MRCFLDLFQYIGFTLFNDIVKLLLTFELIDLELAFKLFLLLNLLLSRPQITFQIDKEIWLLN